MIRERRIYYKLERIKSTLALKYTQDVSDGYGGGGSISQNSLKSSI